MCFEVAKEDLRTQLVISCFCFVCLFREKRKKIIFILASHPILSASTTCSICCVNHQFLQQKTELESVAVHLDVHCRYTADI